MTIRNGLENVAAGKLPTGIQGFDEIDRSVSWAFGDLSDHGRLVEALRQRRAIANG